MGFIDKKVIISTRSKKNVDGKVGISNTSMISIILKGGNRAYWIVNKLPKNKWPKITSNDNSRIIKINSYKCQYKTNTDYYKHKDLLEKLGILKTSSRKARKSRKSKRKSRKARKSRKSKRKSRKARKSRKSKRKSRKARKSKSRK
jgi:hypothetical protein